MSDTYEHRADEQERDEDVASATREDARPVPSRRSGIPFEASEADVLEQSRIVEADPDEDRR